MVDALSLSQGNDLSWPACIFEVGGPSHLTIWEAQADGLPIFAASAAVYAPGPPGMIAEHACAMGPHIVCVWQPGFVGALRRRQVHNHCDGEPLFHLFTKGVEDRGDTPVLLTRS